MPRAPRADEAGAIYHALNRGNARQPIFFKDADYEALPQVKHAQPAGGWFVVALSQVWITPYC
ncbi:MAG: hypothetical protein ACC628_14115 [Pirellulaceae bacterium]